MMLLPNALEPNALDPGLRGAAEDHATDWLDSLVHRHLGEQEAVRQQ